MLKHVQSQRKPRRLSTQTSFLIIITITTFMVLSAIFFSILMHKELTKNYKLLLYQESYSTITALSDDINSIDSIYRLLISNDSIYQYMKNPSPDLSYQYTIEKQMTSVLILNNIWEKNYLQSVFVYTNDGTTFHVSKDNSDKERQTNKNVYDSLSSSSPTLSLFTSPKDNSLYFVRSIYDYSTGNILGTMIVTLDKEQWIKKLTANFSENWQIFLYNDSFSLSSNLNLNITDLEKLQTLAADTKTLQLETISFGGNNYLALSNHIEVLGLTAMVMSPQSQLLKQVYAVLIPCILLIILIIIISVICSFTISHLITKPISVMKSKVDSITANNYSENIAGLEKYDEFYELQAAINNMLNQIHQYHDNILEQNILLKDSEIQALQSQLNPHFIFNVLSTLSWKAEMSGDSEIAQTVVALGEILRFSTVYRTSNTLPLKEELKFIHFYNYLQQQRFEDKITVIEEIDTELEPILIPCFSIQTLVENAYVHGLEPKATPGNLFISVKKRENSLEIVVADDGIGFKEIPDFSSKEISNNSTDGEQNKRPHIGLKNLNRRLSLIYGKESTLHITSVPNKETKISFVIPISKETLL